MTLYFCALFISSHIRA